MGTLGERVADVGRLVSAGLIAQQQNNSVSVMVMTVM